MTHAYHDLQQNAGPSGWQKPQRSAEHASMAESEELDL